MRDFGDQKGLRIVEGLTVPNAALRWGVNLGGCLSTECLVGPIILRRLMLYSTFDDASVARLIEQLLGPAAD